MPWPRCSPWIKRFMGDPCDEILRNHSKGSRRRFYTLWAKSSRWQLTASGRSQSPYGGLTKMKNVGQKVGMLLSTR
ncbi:hypothetical protein EMIT043CA1_270097 [Pseudomonas brassicacearum]